MKPSHAAALVAAFLCVGSAIADPPPVRCMPLAPYKAVFDRDEDISWVALTPEQWNFLRGVSAVVPDMPVGLPAGDRAALIRDKGKSGGIVAFLDGDMVCNPMIVPPELVDLILDVGARKIVHPLPGDPL